MNESSKSSRVKSTLSTKNLSRRAYLHLRSKVRLLLISFTLTACTTAPTKFQDFKSGQWEGHAVIHDNNQKKTYYVDIDWVAVSPDRLRCEVTTSLGIHLASLTVKGNHLSYLLTRQKKYFSGQVNKDSLKSALHFSVDPRILIQILFDSPLGSNWKCAFDAKTATTPTRCVNLSSDLTIAWLLRERAQRKIEIRSADFSLTLELKGFKPNVQVSDSIFDLERPVGFQILSAWNRTQTSAY